MQVKVDRDLCEANAVCCGLAPAVFELDDDEHVGHHTSIEVRPRRTTREQGGRAVPEERVGRRADDGPADEPGRAGRDRHRGGRRPRSGRGARSRRGRRAVVVNDVADCDTVDEIEALGAKALFVAGSVAERATADALVAAATEHFGGLHILVNNAGVTRDRMLFNMTDDEWDTVIGVHLRGHFLLSRNAAAYWRAQAKATGEPVYGRIVNTSSEAGLTGSEGQANYCGGEGRHHGADARHRRAASPGSACARTRSARARARR